MRSRSVPPIISGALLALVLALPAFSAQAGGAERETASAPGVENSVVKVFSTLRRPDLYKPWSKAAPQEISGSGVIIEGHRILTNAHVVGYASQVQVQANQAGDKVSASVVAVSRGMDLAVLKLDDDAFFNAHPPLPRANVLPDVRDAVFAYGYPTGGSALSITKGIVSRIEFAPIHYPVSGLRIQIDAAINPGNSGGPAVAGDKMIGLAFATVSNAQNMGYIIPNEEIELFLRDVADGSHDGKPAMFDITQTLENPALRSFLKLDKSVEGAVVQHPARADAAYPLKEWDVITRVGDYPIDNQGMVKLNANARVRFQYRIQQLARNGSVPLSIMRNGQALKVALPVAPTRPMLIPDLKGAYPSYFIYGPIVFSRATAEFVAGASANANALNAMSFVANPLVTRRGDEPDAQREELVVISAPFFPHKLVTGYSNRFGAVLLSVNGVQLRSLNHLVGLLRDSQDELLTLRFDQRGGETVVLPRKEMVAATESILSDNGIRSQGSPDMLAVWESKAAK